MIIKKIPNNSEHIKTISNWFLSEWGSTLAPLKDEALPVFFVAEETSITGTAHLSAVDMGKAHPEFSPWLAGVFVTKENRGKGIGLALSNAVLNQAQVMGFACCYLYTDSKEKWYSNNGWKIVTREVYKGKNVVVMKYEFPPHQ